MHNRSLQLAHLTKIQLCSRLMLWYLVFSVVGLSAAVQGEKIMTN